MKSFLHKLRPVQRDKENAKQRPLSVAAGDGLASALHEKHTDSTVRRVRARHSIGPSTATVRRTTAEKRRGLVLDKEKIAADRQNGSQPIRATQGDTSPLWDGDMQRIVESGADVAGDDSTEPVVKKVAFKSPNPTPTTSMILDGTPDVVTMGYGQAASERPPAVPPKDQPSRPLRGRRTPSHTPQTSIDSGKALEVPSRPAFATRSTTPNTSASATRPRPVKKPSLPHHVNTTAGLPHEPQHKQALASTSQIATAIGRHRGNSFDSNTTIARSEAFCAPRSGSFCPVQASWSEMAEGDLIDNLSPRERTRQEVLWEIVSSEERYVTELLKLKETFIDALLPSPESATPLIPPLSSPSLSSSVDDGSFDLALSRNVSGSENLTASPASTAPDAFSYLPIASRFASPRPETPADSIPENETPADGDPPKPRLHGHYAYLTFGRPSNQDLAGRFSRGHHSLPPPPRPATELAGTQPQSVSLTQARMSLRPAARRGSHEVHGLSSLSKAVSPSSPPLSAIQGTMRSNKLRKRLGSSSAVDGRTALPAVPPELRQVLEVLGSGILQGHLTLSAALKRRYETQYPLVRSLADVFIHHFSILREYATYVLHLEKALQQIEECHIAAQSNKGFVSGKDQEATDSVLLGKALQTLEDIAADKGESGLVISLSKPFQRLLKYPLLFQNLLYNTDPSTKEYEATLGMVEEVEEIVRSIEDEKTAKEIRDKTRDAFARIEGLENEKGLMAPKASRLLVEEHPLEDDDDDAVADAALKQAAIKNKKSMKRLSDIIKGHNAPKKPELWVVSFTDVSLLCQKIGSTVLPLGSRGSKQDASGKRDSKSTLNRRSTQIQPRNLYKFFKVEEWFVSESAAFRHGLLNMTETNAIRNGGINGTVSPTDPTEHPDDNSASDESDTHSRMSFAFGAFDQLRPLPLPNRQGAPGRASRASTGAISGRLTAPTFASLQRRSSTGIANSNAKFANRLRSPEPGVNRPASRSTTKVAQPRETSLAGTAASSEPPTTRPGRASGPPAPSKDLPRPTTRASARSGARTLPPAPRSTAHKAPGQRI